MSYTTTTTMPGIDAVLDAALSPSPLAAETRTALMANGETVELDTGEWVWVSTFVQDDPATPFIEFATVAIAGDADGPRLRNGYPVSRCFMHGVAPDTLAIEGIAAIRGALMHLALAEPQAIANVSAEVQAARSIRVAIAAADQLDAIPTTVLGVTP